MDSERASKVVFKMWEKLGKQIAESIPDIAINDPARAIRCATYAEACFWKATGENDAHDIKDILPSP